MATGNACGEPSPAAVKQIAPRTGRGLLLSTKQGLDIPTQSGPTLEYGYDATGLNVTTLTRRRANGTIEASATLGYNALGKLETGLTPDWFQTQVVYDPVDRDRVLRATDAVGQLRDFAYDPNVRLGT